MAFYFAVFVGLLLLFILRKVFSGFKSNGNLPQQVPGAVPLFGHLFYLGSHPCKTFLSWKRKYGSMFMVQLGSFRTLVINDAKILKEANKVAFTGRPPMPTFTAAFNNKGLSFTDFHGGEQRQFVGKQLKIFSERGAQVEVIMNDGLSVLLDSFAAKAGRPIPMKDAFMCVILNSVVETLMGIKFPLDDPEIRELASKLQVMLSMPTILALLGSFMPWLSNLMPEATGVTAFVNSHDDLMKFLEEKIKIRKLSHVKDQPRDLLDAYLDCVDNTTDPNSTFHASKNFVTRTIADLFMASSETTSTAAEWLVLLVTSFPSVQKKLQAEISKVIGDSVLPSIKNRPDMPYTEAVLAEVFRFSAFGPMGVPRYTIADTELCGHVIPKDTFIFQNTYGIHHDPEIWGDPQEFRPERFLDADGKFSRNENMVLFGFGRRICLGESYARDQMFLITTRIFQRFNVSFGNTIPPLEGKFGFSIHTDPYEVIFKERE